VEGGLGKAAPATPEVALAGEEAAAGEEFVVLVAVLEVVGRILLKEVEDVVGVEEQVDPVGAQADADKIPMLPAGGLDKS
jgi:hypothetical protein